MSASSAKTKMPALPFAKISPPADIPRLPSFPEYKRPANEQEEANDVARTMRMEPLKKHFHISLPRLGVCIPAISANKLMASPEMRPFILAAKSLRTMSHHPHDPDQRILALNVQHENELDDAARNLISEVGGEVISHLLEIGYDFFKADQVLAALLPEELSKGTPTSFTIIGHIAHLNLRDEYLPYRFLIGDIILDKNVRAVQTVVNKLDVIDTTFRFFAMELLAGEPNFLTVASEQNCSFTFDFRTVYYNSRLQAEHTRIAQLEFKASDVVVDVMAGVGPFAVPAARKERGSEQNMRSAIHAVAGGPGNMPGHKSNQNLPAEGFKEEDAGPCWVLANDLNPASMKSLALNVINNKVQERVFVPLRRDVISQNKAKGKARFVDGDETLPDGAEYELCGLDGREFIRRATRWAWDGVPWYQPAKKPAPRTPRSPSHLIGHSLLETKRKPEKVIRPPGRLPQHFVMNLPDSALEFLDAYRGLFSRIFDGEGEGEAVERELAGEDALGRRHKYPMVHVHCFTRALEDPYTDIIGRANRVLGYEGGAGLHVPEYRVRPPTLASLSAAAAAAHTADSEAGREGSELLMSLLPPVTGDSVAPSQDEVERGREVKIHFVRRVSPVKDMYCLSFRLWADCVWN
ncbi:tRNA(m(1)G37)methyltransferase [Tilletia horrida]|uniref:tRNA (guanine(37)-N1)-methyltransferase n=1 Tax=Tilletia horrida TaxID=155126 RepID=A0AAN6G5G5_9BASI|nr:tRNA(m(1)G37)methyltransferase [Tilletia horrida]